MTCGCKDPDFDLYVNSISPVLNVHRMQLLLADFGNSAFLSATLNHALEVNPVVSI